MKSFVEMEKTLSKKRFFTIFLLTCIMVTGLAVRLDDFRHWRVEPPRAFFQNEPGLINLDGYFYLHLAKDLVRDRYDDVDELRAVPDFQKRPWPPPLLSVVTAGIHTLTHYSLNWIAVFLPPVLGIVLALPLYLLGNFYGGRVMGFTAAITVVLSSFYAYRSALGFFDTDCLNVTFTFSIVYCFLRFGETQDRARYSYFFVGLLLSCLFLWWWDQAKSVVITIVLVPLISALAMSYRPKRYEGIVFYTVLIVVSIGMLLVIGDDFPRKFFANVNHMFSYITGQQFGDFPNFGVNISEQTRPGIKEIVELTTSNSIVFGLSVIGGIWLLLAQPRRCVYLLIPSCIALLSFLYATRFLIFLIPILCLGLGYLCSRLMALQNPLSPLLLPFLILFFAWPMFSRNTQKIYFPLFSQSLVSGMELLSDKTPTNSVIWSSWDQGYPLLYWSDRATINDGSAHTSERTFYSYMPLASDNFRLAANFMQFYVTRGVEGLQHLYEAVDKDRAKGIELLQSIFASGPEEAKLIIRQAGLKDVGDMNEIDEWVRYFYPRSSRPVYIYLTWYMAEQADAWYWFGTWDIAKKVGIHPGYSPHYDVTLYGNNVINASKDLEGNLLSGKIRAKYKMLPISDIYVHNQQTASHHSTGRKGYIFDYYRPGRFATIGDKNIVHSVFHRLFVRHEKSEFFSPKYLNTPDFQIWEVRGERIMEP